MPNDKLRDQDDALALSVLQGKTSRKRDKRRRCSTCGDLYLREELHPDYDDENRQVGLICDGCY